jgi:hypothetical protein
MQAAHAKSHVEILCTGESLVIQCGACRSFKAQLSGRAGGRLMAAEDQSKQLKHISVEAVMRNMQGLISGWRAEGISS